jgi:replicative DNA helicase
VSELEQRVLPHSIEAEMAVIGSIFIKPLAYDEVSDLAVDDFFLPAHREIFSSMRGLAKRGEPIDQMTVAEDLTVSGLMKYLTDGHFYLAKCMDCVPTAENVRTYATTVASKAALRRLIKACVEIESSAYGDHGDTKEFLSDARRKIAAVELPDGTDQPQPISADMRQVVDGIEKRSSDPTSYLVMTGFRKFDMKMGGLVGGNLVVVAARPGKGKSAWTLQVLIDNAFRQVPGLLFSMEMQRHEVIERALAQQGEVNTKFIRTGRMAGPEWMRLNSAAGKLYEVPLWLYSKHQKAERICAMTRRWFAKLKPPEGKRKQAVVAIDYLGLIPSSGNEQDRRHEIGAMTRAFKNLAQELDVPVILLSQLNRETEKEHRKPRLADLRDAGEIEQDADMVIFPWWEGSPPQTGTWPGQFIIGKNRSGSPPGEVDCWWQGEFVRFIDELGEDDQERLPYNDA